MASPAKKGMGLLAIMGGAPEKGASDPMAEKRRAVQEMFAAASRKDWESAAHAFAEAYDICAAGPGDSEEDDDYEDEAALEEE